jgi:hypothetical protein
VNSKKPFNNSDLDAFLITKMALGISEYELFIEAYRDWYGDNPNSKRIDALFGRYLHNMDLPFFVRHYARHYLDRHHEALQSFKEEYRRDKRANALAFSTIILLVMGALALA